MHPNDDEGKENEHGTIASKSDVLTLRFSRRFDSISPDFGGGGWWFSGDCGGTTDCAAVVAVVAELLQLCLPLYVISKTVGSSSVLCTCFLAMQL